MIILYFTPFQFNALNKDPAILYHYLVTSETHQMPTDKDFLIQEL